jgi:hypothetical protein
MSCQTTVLLVLVALTSAHAVPAGTSYENKVRSFKPQRFAEVQHAQKIAQKGPISMNAEGVPDVSVAMQCVILLTILYFFAGFIDLLLNAYERGKKVFFPSDLKGQEEAEENFWIEQIKDAQEAMVHATREVPMLAIVILFSHYRISLDLGYSGPNVDQYPTEVEAGFYAAALIVTMEYFFVFLGMSFQLCAGTDRAAPLLKFGTLFMEISMFLGEFGTIAAVAYTLYVVLTYKQVVVE